MMLIYSISFILGVQETSVFKTSKEHKKSAAEGGGLLRLFFRLLYRCFLDFQDKRYRLASYLMEHISFEAQLCSEMATFKERSKKEQKSKKRKHIAFGGWSQYNNIIFLGHRAARIV